MNSGKERVLVTGAQGMLGSCLMEVLKPEYELFGFGHQELDITRKALVSETVDRAKPAVLINTAAYTKVDDCETHEALARQVNGEVVGALAKICRERKILLIHFSTDYVFDGAKGAPYLETDAAHPLNAYGRSKLAGEEAIFREAPDFLLIRTSWLYGHRGPNFVDKILSLAGADGGKGLRVVDDQTGSPTYTFDLACAVKFLLGRGARGLVHVSNQGTCTWYDFAVAILQRAGMSGVSVARIKSAELRCPTKRPVYSALSTSRLENEFGFAMRPWQEALEEYLKRLSA